MNEQEGVDSSAEQEVEEPAVKRSKRSQQQQQLASSSPAVPVEALPEPKEGVGKSGTRVYESWNEPSTSFFFDALKQCGKDFEAIRKYMAQKSKPECKKNYDQIRNFYYNNLNKISAISKLTQISAPKEAKELFLLVNYGEWQKTTKLALSKQPLPMIQKFNELVLKGSTTVKPAKHKSQTGKSQRLKTVLRTPACPALKKFCGDSKNSSKDLPARVVIQLVPQTYAEKAYVLECEQNPFVRLLLSPNQPLKPYFHYLKKRWITSDLRSREALLGEDIQQLRPKIRWIPEKETVLTKVKVRSSAHAAPGPVCLERIGQVQRDKDEEEAEQSTSNAQTAEEGTRTGSGLALTPDRLREGLTEDTLGNATAAELCLLCNLAPTIRFSYTIEGIGIKEKEKSAPWRCLVSLLLRDYGDMLHKMNLNAKGAKGGDPGASAVGASRKRQGESTRRASNVEDKSAKGWSEAGSSSLGVVGTAVGGESVQNEGAQFRHQAKQLLRSEIVTRKLVGDQQPSLRAPSSSLRVFSPLPAIQTTLSHPSVMPLMTTASGALNLHPPTSLPDQINSSSLAALLPFSPTPSQLDFQDLSTPDNNSSIFQMPGSSMDFASPTKLLRESSSSTLPPDVASLMERMTQEDSVDFCRNFGLGHLAETLETPKKVQMINQ